MDISNNMNNVITYIEEHLTEQINIEILSKIAMCSSYHLSRMFPFLTGVTLSEYIRRRRLTASALELMENHITVLDVAIKYGYDSPTAFTQAFKNMHGIPPSLAKEKGNSLVLYPKLTFHLSLKGDVAMNYRLETKPHFYLTGIKEKISKINGDEDFSRITELWAELNEESANKLLSISNNLFEGLVGASANNKDDCYDYYIAVTSDNTAISGINTIDVPALDWVAFEIVGALPIAMITVWKKIFTDWFPSSGYEVVDAPCLEFYTEGDITSNEYKSEIWVPVKKVS